MRRLPRAPWLVAGVIAVASIDLGTKVWASRALRSEGKALPGPVDLRLSHNRGVAFGALEGLPVGAMIVITLAVTIVVLAAGLKGAIPQLPTAFIAGGALGNAIDRIEGGSVVDLLHTGWWPTFNVADVFITVGVALVALAALRPSPNADEPVGHFDGRSRIEAMSEHPVPDT